MEKEEVQVSVFVIAYNQKEYIGHALNSIVKQKTNFQFEVLVNDDASTDGTQEIIKGFQQKYPDLVFPLFHDQNQYSKGVNPYNAFNYPRAKGKYIAMLEGDDFWCDENKLQTQFDVMEKYPQCSFSTHITRRIKRDGQLMDSSFPDIEIQEGIIASDAFMNYELVIHPWLFQTSSFFLRRSTYDCFVKEAGAFAELFPVGDKPLLLFFAYHGCCYYVKKEMSMYRTNSGGVLSTLSMDINKHIDFEKRFIVAYEEFNRYTNRKYNDEIANIILNKEVDCLILSGNYKNILNKKYRNIFKQKKKRYKVLVYIGTIFPSFIKRLYENLLIIKKRGFNI